MPATEIVGVTVHVCVRIPDTNKAQWRQLPLSHNHGRSVYNFIKHKLYGGKVEIPKDGQRIIQL
jgi:hypothetical protein